MTSQTRDHEALREEEVVDEEEEIEVGDGNEEEEGEKSKAMRMKKKRKGREPVNTLVNLHHSLGWRPLPAGRCRGGGGT